MTAQYILPAMSEPTVETKIMKSWRLRADIVKKIEDGNKDCGYPNETAYIEALLCLVYDLPNPPMPKPKLPRVRKKALAMLA